MTTQPKPTRAAKPLPMTPMNEKQAARAKRALERAIASSKTATALAEACGVTRQAISAARATGYASLELAKRIEAATGISKVELRPDIWGRA